MVVWGRATTLYAHNASSISKGCHSPIPSSHSHIFKSWIKMALIVDKHRPRSLDALTYHPELSERLQSLVREE